MAIRSFWIPWLCASVLGSLGCPSVRTVAPGVVPRIAVLAPLSGSSREVGKRLRRGALLAGQAARGRFELVFADTRGEAAGAREAVERLARDARVAAVVGPVLARESLAAAARAADLGLPLVALSPASRLPERGRMIFRCFLTPERQARAVAAHAVSRLGLRRIAILHPRSPYGEAMRAAFADEVSRHGGILAGVVSYPRGRKGFRREARALRRLRMDGIFFPDGHRTVALATGYLAAGGIPIGATAGGRDVRLLGTNEWISEELLRQAGRYVQGAVLAAGFAPGADRMAARFAAAFEALHGRPPGFLEAYAHDAVRLVGAALERADAATAGMARALAAVEVMGATGTLRFDEGRELAGSVPLVRIEGAGFTPLR
jgi:branched-chain amino acid transport system substrate-binding protein